MERINNKARMVEAVMANGMMTSDEFMAGLEAMKVTVKRGARLMLDKSDDKYHGNEYLVAHSEGMYHLINAKTGAHRGACSADGIDRKAIPLHKIIGPSTDVSNWTLL